MVNGFFAKLTRRRLQRGVFRSLVDLQAAINRYLADHNTSPKPFVLPAPDPLPLEERIVRIVAGELPAVVDAAEALLLKLDPGVYEFADQPVRPALRAVKIADDRSALELRLVPIRLHDLMARFTRCVRFLKYSRTRGQWEPADCPEIVASVYLERVGARRLPQLSAITCCPLMLPSGRIVATPGYDPASGILFDPQGAIFPPVPRKPSKDDAVKALRMIANLFREFPFIGDASRSVHYSGMLSGVARTAFDFAPLHAYDAPASGTGKSKLVDACVMLTTGHQAPVVSLGDNEVELEKRLGAELLEGARLVSIDNCDEPLGGKLLCQTCTQAFLKIRVLGQSKNVLVANGTLIFATGNNLRLYGDMLRRGLISRLDAGVERPELRSFAREDPVSVLARERGGYVTAALTVPHAYNHAGRPTSRQPLGGFEGWSALVRDNLLWVDQADRVETTEEARKADPVRHHLEAVITRWLEVISSRTLTVRAVIDEACATSADFRGRITFDHPEFRNALLDVAAGSTLRDRVSADLLGKWIAHNQHKVVGKHRLAAGTVRDGSRRWRLEERDESGVWK